MKKNIYISVKKQLFKHCKALCLFSTMFFLSNLSNAQKPYFYGLSTNGGDGIGSLFRTDTTGKNFTLLDSFAFTDNGRRPFPTTLLESGGKLYGVTTNGGKNGMGTLFEYSPSTNTYVVKFHFINNTGNYKGTNPACHLLLAANGKIYGTTMSGGSNDNGTLFEYAPGDSNISILHSFSHTAQGSQPRGILREIATGVIMGVCENGGANNSGTLFQFNYTTNTYTKRADFNRNVTGGNPQGGIMKANNGKIYGLASNGGSNSYGTLFEFDLTNDMLIAKIHFDGMNGYSPISNLVQLPNGKLYGNSQYGGQSGLGKGVLFEYDITKDTLVRKNVYASTSIGYYPAGDLLETTGGKYLMIMRTGGPNDFSGTIAEYNSGTNTVINKVNFDRVSLGAAPDGNLVKFSSNGKYYGICGYGGVGDNGVIFEYDYATNALTKKIDLSPYSMGNTPSKSLVLAANGKLYGTTENGGAGYGTVFEVNPQTGKINKIADFEKTNGARPVGTMVQASNGMLYGVTQSGGNASQGVLFKFDPSTNVISLVKSINSISGNYPYAGLMIANNGKIYGTTTSGGANNYGLLFEYDITTDVLVKKADFDNTNNGTSTYAKLMQASNGKLYGTNYYGGSNNIGTIYEFDLGTNNLSGVAHFDGSNGSRPWGGLFQASNGKMYGMTTQGNNQYGVFYEFDPVGNNLTVKANFNRFTHGYAGNGEFIEGKNGKLYGLSAYSNNNASPGAQILEYDIAKDTFISLGGVAGSATGNLIQVNGVFGLSVKQMKTSTLNVNVYPNPATDMIYIQSTETIKSITLCTVDGKKVLTTFNNVVDVHQLHSGFYILLIETESSTISNKLLIQK